MKGIIADAKLGSSYLPCLAERQVLSLERHFAYSPLALCSYRCYRALRGQDRNVVNPDISSCTHLCQ